MSYQAGLWVSGRSNWTGRPVRRFAHHTTRISRSELARCPTTLHVLRLRVDVSNVGWRAPARVHFCANDLWTTWEDSREQRPPSQRVLVFAHFLPCSPIIFAAHSAPEDEVLTSITIGTSAAFDDSPMGDLPISRRVAVLLSTRIIRSDYWGCRGHSASGRCESARGGRACPKPFAHRAVVSYGLAVAP
jgi:hypothetical protein